MSLIDFYLSVSQSFFKYKISNLTMSQIYQASFIAVEREDMSLEIIKSIDSGCFLMSRQEIINYVNSNEDAYIVKPELNDLVFKRPI